MKSQKLVFGAFNKPVRFHDAWRAASDYGHRAPAKATMFVLVAIIIFAYLSIFLITFATGASLGATLVLVLLFMGAPLVLGGLAAYFTLRTARMAVRLTRFAKENGFMFFAQRDWHIYPGLVFTIGHSRQFTTVITGTFSGLSFELGNYQCTVGSGRSSRRRNFGVVEVKLPRKLPHILLDSRANNTWGFSNLPRFRGSQRLSLEGNFDNYFTLYAPTGYERDALYVFSPELMALMIDFGAAFDIEIVDDRLYIFSAKAFDLGRQPTLAHIFDLIDVLGSEMHKNTSRYADANVGNRRANIVAEPGRRLRRAFSWVALLLLLVYLSLVAWGVFD